MPTPRLLRLRNAAVAGVVVTGALVAPLTANASEASHDRVVSADPANWTPHALDNSVLSIEQVGEAIVAGGDFTRIASSDSGTELDQAGVFAFDATSGDLLPGFRPQITGGNVETVAAHPDGDKVFIGGTFKYVNGVKWPKLALLSLADGSLVTSFKKAPMNGKVLDLAVQDGRVILGGTWTKIKGRTQGHLASLKVETGAYDPFISLPFAGTNNGGKTRVSKFDVSLTGSRLVAIGNFTGVDGLSRGQVAVVNLTGSRATVADWQTSMYPNHCSATFDSYVREVDIDPEGQYFVVVSTGAFRQGRLCDTAARWELRETGSNLKPTWVNYTGGDTLYSVAATNHAVYVGGHQRWHNNSYAADRAGAGAVAREGIAALDPINGLPLSWNPGRDRGVGAFALTATPSGLWVGSDTERIGRYEYHGRLAFFPLAGGTVPPTVVTGEVPGRVLSLGDGASDIVATQFDGSQLADPVTLPPTSSAARAATMISGKLYSARATGTFDVADWDGESLGSSTPIPDLNISAWRSDLASMTGMYFRAGKLYYTLNGNSNLFYRYFSIESGVIGAERFTASGSVSGLSFGNVRGMTLAGDNLLWVDAGSGELRRTELSAGVPTAGTTSSVSGPAVDGTDWRRGPLVMEATADGPASNLAPVANAGVTCDGLDCSFTSVGSGDPDGQLVSRSWDLGDGTVVNGATAQHTYLSEGPFTATLTVTDDLGLSRSTSIEVRPDAAPVPVAVVDCSGLECVVDASASTDGQGSPVGYAWTFGDGATATGAVANHTYTQAGSYTIGLTVTDDEGGSASSDTTVTVADNTEAVTFVDAAKASSTWGEVNAQIPSGSAAGDGLLLIVTGNRSDTDYSSPGNGWSEVARVSDADMTTIAWQREARAADAGQTVGVTTSATAKLDMQLLVYRGVDVSSVLRSATAVAGSFTTDHVTPTVAAGAGSVAVSYWADKTSATASWTPPADVSVRGESIGTGGGRITSLIADQEPRSADGNAGGLTAVADAPSGKATMLTIVLAPRVP